MAKGDIVSVTSRLLTDEEKDLAAWFEKQEADSVGNLEAGARQIIALITAFYGLVFGVISLGSDKLEASLRSGWVISFGGAAVGILLAALGAALFAVAPRRYAYREASLVDRRAAYKKIVARKSKSLLWANILFGRGLAAFAALIISMLLARL